MHCVVYRSPKRDLLYLFVREKDVFDDVPAEVMRGFGPPEFAMELELEPGRQLAQANADEVIANLKARGFHIQMPPQEKHPWL